MVQLVASAAASAIVSSTVATQTQDGRARQTSADQSGGGWFGDLLAELLEGAQSSQDAAAFGADPAQPGASDPSAAGESAKGSKNASSANGQSNAGDSTVSGQTNLLAAWTAALAQQMQQIANGKTPTTSPKDALAALLEGQQGGKSTKPADGLQTSGTSDSTNPQDANLLAALQSLAAQFAQDGTQAGTQPQNTQPTAGATTSGTDSAPAVSSAPSNAQLAAMLQTLKADEAAMTGTPAASDPQQATQTPTNTAATTSNAAPANAATQTAQFPQASQHASHQTAQAPVTQAQALPQHSNSGGSSNGSSNNSSQGQTGSERGSSTNTSADAPTQGSSNGTPDASSNSNLPTFLQVAHDQAQAQQNTATTSAAAQNNAVNAVAGTTPSQAPAQPTAATLQVGPATAQTATPNVHALAVSIATQSQAGTKQFDIRLDPPELGRVDVRLTVDAAGKAQAHLAVDKPQTLELLQKNSGNLARALKDSGVQLSNNGLQFSLKGQGRHGGRRAGFPIARPFAFCDRGRFGNFFTSRILFRLFRVGVRRRYSRLKGLMP